MQSVQIWFNAFIPGDISGLTEPAPSNHSGKTMIRGPIPGVSDCFLTDNRGFSNDINALSRMHSEIEININTISTITEIHRCDTTREIDCEDGDIECEKKADTSRMSFSNLRKSSGLILVDLKGAANNPCFTGSPDIDYEGIITIDVNSRIVKFEGKIDAFPAFEMYAKANDGQIKTVLREPPPLGNNPSDLFGGANRTLSVQVSI